MDSYKYISNGIVDNYASLVKDFRCGDANAFDKLFRAYYPSLCFYSFKITNEYSISQEIAEESFMKAWAKRESIVNLKSYLYRVTKNASLDWIKREQRQKQAEELGFQHSASMEGNVFDALVKAELLREIRTAINLLPPKRRQVIKMLYEEGKSVKQVAEELKVSPAAVKQHKKEGILFLRKIIPIFVFMSSFQNW